MTLRGIHRGLPQLLGVHLTETLVALDLEALAPELLDHRGDVVPALDGLRLALVVRQRERLDELRAELAGGLAQLDELGRANDVRADRSVAANTVHARAVAQLPRAVLAVLLVLGRGLRQLGIALAYLGEDLRLEQLELVAVLEHVLGQPLVGELHRDASITPLVHLLAQAAHLVDALDQARELVAGERRRTVARQHRLLAHAVEEVVLERALVLEIELGLALLDLVERRLRDEYMEKLHQQYPEYQWNINKGYPTEKHRKAIQEFGPTEYHRVGFNLLGNGQLNLFE